MDRRPAAVAISALFLLILLSGCTGDEKKGTEKPVFIAVHCEPGAFPDSTQYQNEKWPALVKLVRSADEHGHKLTILFNPQWATYVLADQKRTDLVRAWVDDGHEVGLHSHGPSLNNWNGYTDQPEHRDDKKFIGGIAEMMALMADLPGDIWTAAVTDEDQDEDYPPGIPYDVDGGWNGEDDLVSTSAQVVINGEERTQLRHARYSDEAGAGSEISVPLAHIGSRLDGMGAGEVMGIVFHVFDYQDRPLEYERMFEYLDGDEDVRTRTVSDILG